MNDKTLSIIINAQDRASKVLADVGDTIARVSKIATAAAAAGAVAFAAFAVKSAAAYEQSLNIMKSVSGATAEQMAAVAAKARELGKDISLPGVSSKDAALAMVELSKAGLSVNDTLAASKGVLSLAKAGQLETGQAAEIAANALNAFNLKGSEAARVADLLAAAANASSASVSDIAIGMQMSAASAASMKIPVQDLATLLGEMSNNGIKGSDAGTSLKTMFMALTPTTDKARNAMSSLNLDFFKADGTFVGMRDTIKQLQEKTKGLTDEQRLQKIETIFGSDASRAANILIKEGVAGYDKLAGAVGRSGAAAALAKAQNSGLNGALDAFKSTAETIATDIGLRLLPVLTNLAMAAIPLLERGFEALKTSLMIVQDVFRGWDPGALMNEETFAKWKGFVGVIDAVKLAVDYLTPKFQALMYTVRDDLLPVLTQLWKNVLLPLLPVIGVLLVAALGLAVDALNIIISAFTGLWNMIASGNPIIWGLIGVFGSLAAVMAFNAVFNALTIGFHTLTLITIPSVVAHVGALQALIASPVVFGAIAIGAALVALALIKNAADEARSAVENASRAADSASKSNDDVIRNLRAQSRAPFSPQVQERSRRALQGLADGGSFATGTNYAPGGRTLVGEFGPEYVDMPRGSKVHSNGESANMGGGTNITTVSYTHLTLPTKRIV